MKNRPLKTQFQNIRTADDLAQWASDMYEHGDLSDSEMLPGTNLQPWDFPDGCGWEQSDDNGEDFTVTAPDGSQARWSNRDRKWIVL